MKPLLKTLRARLGLAVVALALSASALNAQTTNTIFGYVGDYGLAPKSRVPVTINLVEPTDRTVGHIAVRADGVTTTTGDDGYFAFHNLIWGKYRLAIAGRPGVNFSFTVQTNTQGTVPITSLIISTNPLPPNPTTNYYTQAQVDALFSEIGKDGINTNLYAKTNDLYETAAALSYRAFRNPTNSSLFAVSRALYYTNFGQLSSLPLSIGSPEMVADVAGDILLVGSGAHFAVISVTNRAAPVLLTNVATPGLVKTITHQGSFFYVGGVGFLSVWNCRIPQFPVLTTNFTFPTLSLTNISTETDNGPETNYVDGTYTLTKSRVSGELAFFIESALSYGPDYVPGRIQIYSLANPSAPVLLSTIVSTSGSTFGDVLNIGELLYIANYSGRTLQVASINDPRRPVIIHSQAMEAHGNVSVFEPWRLLQKDNALYVFDDNTIQVFSLNNPTNPAFSSAIQVYTDAEGAQIVDDTLLFGSSGINRFIPTIPGVVAFDIQNPLSPSFICQTNTGWTNGFFWFAADHDYLYLPSPNAVNIINLPSIARFGPDTSTLLVDITNSIRFPLASNNVGRVLSVKITANITNVLSTIGNDRIELQSTRTMTNGQAATFQSDGTTNWYRISP